MSKRQRIHEIYLWKPRQRSKEVSVSGIQVHHRCDAKRADLTTPNTPTLCQRVAFQGPSQSFGARACAPSDVQIAVVIFVFPTRDPIPLEDKDVHFILQLGSMEFNCKFSLKDMSVDGMLLLRVEPAKSNLSGSLAVLMNRKLRNPSIPNLFDRIMRVCPEAASPQQRTRSGKRRRDPPRLQRGDKAR